MLFFCHSYYNSEIFHNVGSIVISDRYSTLQHPNVFSWLTMVTIAPVKVPGEWPLEDLSFTLLRAANRVLCITLRFISTIQISNFKANLPKQDFRSSQQIQQGIFAVWLVF